MKIETLQTLIRSINKGIEFTRRTCMFNLFVTVLLFLFAMTVMLFTNGEHNKTYHPRSTHTKGERIINEKVPNIIQGNITRSRGKEIN